MKSYQNNEDIGSGKISIDSAEFVCEGTYNYYAVTPGMDREDIEMHKFSFSEPVNDDSTINLTDVGDAFWRMKDTMMVAYDNIDYSGKELCDFDITTQLDGNGGVTINVEYIIFTGPKVSVGPTKTFTQDDNHAWKTYQPGIYGTSGASTYEKGQCDLDITNKSIITNSQNNSVLGAAGSLRNYGLNNYWGYASNSPGYYVNIQSAWVGGMSQPTISSPSSTYTSMSIVGYDNTTSNGNTFNVGVWATWYLCNNSYNYSDPNIVFKDYLLTGMMNFYLALIPGYISANVPSGRVLYDFNISMFHPIYPYLNPNTSPNIYNQIAIQEHYMYEIKYGNYIKQTPNGLGLSNM